MGSFFLITVLLLLECGPAADPYTSCCQGSQSDWMGLKFFCWFLNLSYRNSLHLQTNFCHFFSAVIKEQRGPREWAPVAYPLFIPWLMAPPSGSLDLPVCASVNRLQVFFTIIHAAFSLPKLMKVTSQQDMESVSVLNKRAALQARGCRRGASYRRKKEQGRASGTPASHTGVPGFKARGKKKAGDSQRPLYAFLSCS